MKTPKTPKTPTTHLLTASLVLVSFVACSESQGAGTDAPAQTAGAPTAVVAPVSETVAPEALAGLGPGEPFEVTAARPWEAKACVSGTRAGLDLLVCRYADEAAAEANKKKLKEFLIGAQSGAVTRSGDTLLAVADKAKVDPKGYEIARLVEAFAPSKPPAP